MSTDLLLLQAGKQGHEVENDREGEQQDDTESEEHAALERIISPPGGDPMPCAKNGEIFDNVSLRLSNAKTSSDETGVKATKDSKDQSERKQHTTAVTVQLSEFVDHFHVQSVHGKDHESDDRGIDDDTDESNEGELAFFVKTIFSIQLLSGLCISPTTGTDALVFGKGRVATV